MLTPNKVEVTWDQSPDVTGYLISCTSRASYAGGKIVMVNGGDTTSHILCNLVENTPYDITVQGLTRDGKKGLCSDKVSVITPTAGMHTKLPGLKPGRVTWVMFCLGKVGLTSFIKCQGLTWTLLH